jgi:Leucine-rich repeat (LRR) protein
VIRGTSSNPQNIECILEPNSEIEDRQKYECIFENLVIEKNSKLIINATTAYNIEDHDVTFLHFRGSQIFLLHQDILNKFPNITGIKISDTSELLNQSLLESCQNLKSLEFSIENFSNISDSTFKNCHSLETLSIETNSIKEFPDSVFLNQRKLTKLSLSGAEFIFKITPFEKLTNLETLIFRTVKISYIEFDFFRSFKKLRQLHFIFRNYGTPEIPRNLPMESLRFHKTLVHLEVKLLNLSKIPKNFVPILRTLENLTDLNLNYNFIESLNGFSNLLQLKALKVDGNKIQEIPLNFLEGCPNLEKLDLSNNVITLVHPEAFHNFRNLQILDLSHNRIGKLGGGIFQDNRKLESIDLSNNQINILFFGFLTQHPQLRSLDMAGNLCAHWYIQIRTFELFGLQDKLRICYSSWYMNRQYLPANLN